MNNPSIPPSYSSIMTSHSPSTVQVSPSYGHSIHSIPPPKKSAGRKMGIFRADSGIAIKPDTKNAIPNPDQLNSSSSAPPKEDPTDITPTDTPDVTSTFNMNDITNLISKLDQLNTHFRAILTPIPGTPIAYLDDSTSTCELSTGDNPPSTFVGENEQEDPFDAFADTTGATVANGMSGTISKIDQILEQISVIRHITSSMSSSLDDFLLKDSIIPESNIEKGKGKGKEEEREQTPVPPTISPTLPSASHPPSSPPAEHIEHGVLRFKLVDKLSPIQELRFQPRTISERLRRTNRRMKKRKEKEEQTPITSNLLSAPFPLASPSPEQTPTQPPTPIISSDLPPSSPSPERIHRHTRTLQWISELALPQKSSHTGYRALATLLFLQRKISLMKEQSKDGSSFTPTSDVLDPYYWTLRDAITFACPLSSEPAENPISASPKEKHPTHPQPPKEEAEPILAGPYSEPSMSRPSTSKPWICRPSKREASRNSEQVEGLEGEKEGEEGKGEGEKKGKLVITRMVVFRPGQSMESVLESIRAEEKEKEKKKKNQQIS